MSRVFTPNITKLNTAKIANCELIFSFELSLKVKNFCKEKDKIIPILNEIIDATKYHTCNLWTKINRSKNTDAEVTPPEIIYRIILLLITFCI